MGLASLLLGKENPFSQFVDSRQNTLGAWGAGLASGPSFQQGLSNAVQYGAQAAPLDQQAAEQRRAEEEAKAQMNRTAEYLRSVPGGEPFADAIEKGGVDASTAFKGWFEFSQPKPPGAQTSDIQNFLFGQENPGFIDYQTQKGGAAERSLTPTYMRDANGNIVIGQMDKAGNITPSAVPEGMSAVDPFQMAGGKAGATVDAKTAAAARAAMRGAEVANSNTAKAIADVRNNAAGMNEWFGQIGPRGIYINPGSAMGKFWAAAEPTNNQAFMQAREMLKGGGQITDYEGRKAEDAFSRMRAALEKGDQQQYLNALADFEESVAIGYQKLVETAQGGYSQGGAAVPAAGGGVDDILSKYGL